MASPGLDICVWPDES